MKVRGILETICISDDTVVGQFGYEKNIRKMGAGFALKSLQTKSDNNFEELFGVVRSQSSRAFSPFHNCRRNIFHHNSPDIKQQTQQWVIGLLEELPLI